MREVRFDQKSRRLLPTNVVARRLGKSVRTVRWYAKTGQIPAIKIGIKLWKFDPSDVDAFKVRDDVLFQRMS